MSIPSKDSLEYSHYDTERDFHDSFASDHKNKHFLGSSDSSVT